MIGLHQTMSVPYAFALSDIVSIGDPVRPRGGGAEHRNLKLTGDRSSYLLGFEVDDLMLRPVQLLPAEPGTCYVMGDIAEKPTIWTDPVIAWAICLDGQIRIVTPNGVVSGLKSDVHVEMPGGGIYGVGEYTAEPEFADRVAYLAWLKSRWLKELSPAALGSEGGQAEQVA